MNRAQLPTSSCPISIRQISCAGADVGQLGVAVMRSTRMMLSLYVPTGARTPVGGPNRGEFSPSSGVASAEPAVAVVAAAGAYRAEGQSDERACRAPCSTTIDFSPGPNRPVPRSPTSPSRTIVHRRLYKIAVIPHAHSIMRINKQSGCLTFTTQA